MDIYEAAELLQERFRDSPWFTAVAVGGLDEKEVIFVYTKKAVRDRFLDKITASGWKGHDVKVQKVGRVQPIVA